MNRQLLFFDSERAVIDRQLSAIDCQLSAIDCQPLFHDSPRSAELPSPRIHVAFPNETHPPRTIVARKRTIRNKAIRPSGPTAPLATDASRREGRCISADRASARRASEEYCRILSEPGFAVADRKSTRLN